MNNASGSIVRKLSFALALIIAAALGYFAVRYRLGMDQERADAVAGDAVAAAASVTPVASGSGTVPLKPNYLPLRPRAVTNMVHVGTNRPIVRPGLSDHLLDVFAAEAVVTKVSARDTRTAGGAFAGDRQLARSNSNVGGRVVLRGTPPPEKSTPVDATCGQLRATPLVTSRHYVVSSDGGLANTFVYIKVGAPAGGVSGAAPSLDQVGCEYQPYVIGVRTGQTFMVKNSDATFHNVHSLPKNPGNREKNVAQALKGMSSSFAFAKSELFVQFKCEVHSWMFAYVGVVDHPWFAVTDQNGDFSLQAGLPPGQYTLAAVHLKAGEILQQIDVTETGVEPVTFTFDLPSNVAKSDRP